MKKILIVTPKFPFPETGACEQDRASGIKDFIRYGYDVRVITKVAPVKVNHVQEVAQELGIPITPIAYKFTAGLSFGQKLNRVIKRSMWLPYWDGAAYEYVDSEIQNAFVRELDEHKPDIVWVDYTYLWPLYKHAQKRNIPIVTRSINFEPTHFLDEDGKTIMNFIKFIPKFISELITIRKSDLVFSITPKEEKIYKKLGAQKIANLPLRGLPRVLKQARDIQDKQKLELFFMGSTYNVPHNKRALGFLLNEVVPALKKETGSNFVLHVTGAKAPKEFEHCFNDQVVYEGYVDDLNAFLETMDVAVTPSLMGSGMQQKIFEPVVRGIPEVVSSRGIADYPLENGKHLILADSVEAFVKGVSDFQNVDKRRDISANALEISNTIFSRSAIDSIIEQHLKF